MHFAREIDQFEIDYKSPVVETYLWRVVHDRGVDIGTRGNGGSQHYLELVCELINDIIPIYSNGSISVSPIV